LNKYGDGVSLHKGTLSDPSSVEAAIKGCDAVVLNQWPSFTDHSEETREAGTLLDLAKAAGVKHVVHSTQLALSDPDFINQEAWTKSSLAPAVLGKYEVEQLVRDSGIPWTILRPGWFTSNILPPILSFYFPNIAQGKIDTSYRPDAIIALVVPEDIGAFAAAAFNAPEKFAGKALPVVSEWLTTAEILDQFVKASGREYEVHYWTEEETAEMAKTNPIILGQTLTHGLEKWAPMNEVESWGVPLTTFREFLETNKDKIPN
jgi:uncharacterized protein YbjT (DUF2867 family)